VGIASVHADLSLNIYGSLQLLLPLLLAHTNKLLLL
jgi:hypothetical protein